MTITNPEIGIRSGVLLRQLPKICCIVLVMIQQMLMKLISEAGRRKPMLCSGKIIGKTVTCDNWKA